MKGKPQLLVETIPATFRILDEASSTQKGQSVKIRCEHMSVADEVNGNGRLYPFGTWKREIDKLQKKLETAQLVGSADHPDDGRSRISDAAIKWTAVGMNEKVTWGEGEIIPTAKGKDLEALVRSGVTVGISSRGYGSGIQRNMNGRMVTVVQEDFSLQTFDAVLGQSVEGAHLAVVESQQGGRQSMNWKELIESLKKEHAEAFMGIAGQSCRRLHPRLNFLRFSLK